MLTRSVKVGCEHCHQTSVLTHTHQIGLCHQTTRPEWAYWIHCPKCRIRSSQPIQAAIANQLLTSGVNHQPTTDPNEPRPTGPPFTHNDLTQWAQYLNNPKNLLSTTQPNHKKYRDRE